MKSVILSSLRDKARSGDGVVARFQSKLLDQLIEEKRDSISFFKTIAPMETSFSFTDSRDEKGRKGDPSEEWRVVELWQFSIFEEIAPITLGFLTPCKEGQGARMAIAWFAAKPEDVISNHPKESLLIEVDLSKHKFRQLFLGKDEKFPGNAMHLFSHLTRCASCA